MMSDLQLRQEVERELAWDPKIDASKIAVIAKDGAVTLSGKAPQYLDKWEAERIAKRVVGVTGVANDIDVTLDSNARDDTDLLQAVLNALRWNVSVPSNEIKAVVRDGWVALEGKVKWHYQKTAAESAIRYLNGVKGVNNKIEIDNPVEPEKVSEKITEALLRNARIDAHLIKVTAQGQTAVLEGSVRSWAERDEAETAAWAAPGVNLVENRLSLRYS